LSESEGYLPTSRSDVIEALYPSDGFAPDGYIRVKRHRSVFDLRDVEEILLPVGMTIEEILNDEFAGKFSENTMVTVGDQNVPRDLWPETIAESGSLVRVSTLPAGEYLLIAAIVATVVSVALTIAGAITGNQYLMIAGAAVGLLGMGLGTWGVGLGAGLTVGTTAISGGTVLAVSGIALGAANIAAGLIARPQKQKGRDPGFKSSPHLKGLRNRTRKYEPVSKIYGRVKIAPSYGQLPYSRALGGEQYFFGRFIIGKGPVQVSDIRIGETSIYDFAALQASSQSLNALLDSGFYNGSTVARTLGTTSGSRFPHARTGDYMFGTDDYAESDERIWLYPYNTQNHPAWISRGGRLWDDRDIRIPARNGNMIHRHINSVCMPPHPTDSITATVVDDTYVEAIHRKIRTDEFTAIAGWEETWITISDVTQLPQVNDFVELPIADSGEQFEWEITPAPELDSLVNHGRNRYLGGLVTELDTTPEAPRFKFQTWGKFSAAPYGGTVKHGAAITLCWGGENARNGSYNDVEDVAYRFYAYRYAGTDRNNISPYVGWDSSRLYRLDAPLGQVVNKWGFTDAKPGPLGGGTNADRTHCSSIGDGLRIQVRNGFPGEPPLTIVTDSIVLDELAGGGGLLVSKYTGWYHHESPIGVLIRSTQENTSSFRLTFNVFPQWIGDPDGDRWDNPTRLMISIEEDGGDAGFSNEFRAVANSGCTVAGATTYTYRGEYTTVTRVIAVDLPGSKNMQTVAGIDCIPHSATVAEGAKWNVKVEALNWIQPGGKLVLQGVYWAAIESTLGGLATRDVDVAEIQLRIQSTDVFTGILQELNCVVDSLIPYHDGDDWVTPTANSTSAELTEIRKNSRNPAWQVADIMRGNGGIKPIDDRFVDVESLREFADWCDNPFTGESGTLRPLLESISRTCTLAISTTVTLDEAGGGTTASIGLAVGTPVSTAAGTDLHASATVASITDETHFELSHPALTSGSGKELLFDLSAVQQVYPVGQTEFDLAMGEFWATRDDITVVETIPPTSSAFTGEFWESTMTSPATDFDSGKYLHVTLRRPLEEAEFWDESDWKYTAEIIKSSDSSSTGEITATDASASLPAGEWVTLHWDFTSEALVTTANACTIRVHGLDYAGLPATDTDIYDVTLKDLSGQNSHYFHYPGTFITWADYSGEGEILSFDPTTLEMSLRRTSGVAPSLGDEIWRGRPTNSGSGHGQIDVIRSQATGHSSANIARVWVDDSETGNGEAVYDHKFFLRGSCENDTVGTALRRWQHTTEHATDPATDPANVGHLPIDPVSFSYLGSRLHEVQLTTSSGDATDTVSATGTFRNSTSTGATDDGCAYRITLSSATTAAVNSGSEIYELFLPMKCDGVFDFATTQGEAMEQIAAIGHGSVRYRDAMVGVTIDKPRMSKDGVVDTPVTLITPRNIKGGSIGGVRTYPEVAHATRVNFTTVDGVTAERLVYRPGYDDNPGDGVKAATVFDAMDTWGIINPDQVEQFAKFNIIARDLRNEIITVETDIEAMFIERGDIVEFGHDVPMIGTSYARLTATTLDGSSNLETITTDEPSTLEYGKSYGVRIRTAAGILSDTGVTNPATSGTPTVSTKVLTVTGTIAEADAPAAGDLVAFGELGLETSRMIVIGIQPTEDLGARFTMVPEAPEIWTELRRGDNIRPTYDDSRTVVSTDTAPGVPRLTGHTAGPDFIDLFVSPALGDAVITSQFEASWHSSTDTESTDPMWSDSVVVRAKASTAIRFPWAGPNPERPHRNRGERNFRVRAIRADNPIASNWVYTEPFSVTLDKVFRPDNVRVTHLEAATSDGDINVSWSRNIGDGAGDTLTRSHITTMAPVGDNVQPESASEAMRPSVASHYITNHVVMVVKFYSGFLYAEPATGWQADWQAEYVAIHGSVPDLENDPVWEVAREEVIGPETNWIYTHAMIVADNEGKPSRGLHQISVWPVVEAIGKIQNGRQYISLYDQPPPTPNLLQLSQPAGGVSIEILWGSGINHQDIAGMNVWASQTSGFEPSDETLIYSGESGQVLNIPALSAVTYYLRWAAFDEFYQSGDPAGTLNLSDEEREIMLRPHTSFGDVAVGDLTNIWPDPNFSYVGEGVTKLDSLFSVYDSGISSMNTHPLWPDGYGTGGWKVTGTENGISPAAGGSMLRYDPEDSAVWSQKDWFAVRYASTPDAALVTKGNRVQWTAGPFTYVAVYEEALLDGLYNIYYNENRHPAHEPHPNNGDTVALVSDPSISAVLHADYGLISEPLTFTGTYISSPKFEADRPFLQASSYSDAAESYNLPEGSQVLAVRPGDQYSLEFSVNRTQWYRRFATNGVPFFFESDEIFSVQLFLWDSSGDLITRGSLDADVGNSFSLHDAFDPENGTMKGVEQAVVPADTWSKFQTTFTVPSYAWSGATEPYVSTTVAKAAVFFFPWQQQYNLAHWHGIEVRRTEGSHALGATAIEIDNDTAPDFFIVGDDIQIQLDDSSWHVCQVTGYGNSGSGTNDQIIISPGLASAAGDNKIIAGYLAGRAAFYIDEVEFKPVTQSRGIGASAVVAEKLATDSVETAKILDANVTTPKIAADSVTTRATLKTTATSYGGTIAVAQQPVSLVAQQALSLENAETSPRPMELTWTGEMYRANNYSTNADFAAYFSAYAYTVETTLAAAWPSGTNSIAVTSSAGFAVGDLVTVGLHPLNYNMTHAWEIQSITTLTTPHVITFTANNYWAAVSGALVFKHDDGILHSERVVPAEATGSGALQSFSFSAISTLPASTTSKIMFSLWNNGNNFYQDITVAAGAHYDAKIVKR